MQKLRMEHIYKSYGQAVVLQDISYAFTPDWHNLVWENPE